MTYRRNTPECDLPFPMQHRKWDKLDHAEMTAMEAIFMLDNLVDSSDPDVGHSDMCGCIHSLAS